MKTNLNRIFGCCLGGGLLFAQAVHAQLTFTNENAGVQATTVPGVTTETFDSLSTGAVTTYTDSIGTFTGGSIHAADIFGAAGGTGNYYVIGSQSGTLSATLTLTTPEDYFGMWWSAGDSGNHLEFYDGATLIGSYDVGNALSGLPSGYNGNPNNGGDSGEPFAYLDLTTSGATQITSIVFTNLDLSSGFEMDNFSVLPTQITPPGNPIGGNAPDSTNTGLLLMVVVSALFGVDHRHQVLCKCKNRAN